MSTKDEAVPLPVWETQAMLGEGVMWDAAQARVWFVDIKGRRIHRCAGDGSDPRSWDAPGQVSFIVPAVDGGMVCSLDDGLYRFIEDNGEFVPLVSVESDQPGNRFNDGHVDSRGHLWFGSMDDAEKLPSGVLYRYDRGQVERMDDGYIITNGPALSPDGGTLYHTDTLGKCIYAFDLGLDGALSNKRLFVEMTDGYPDGMAVDVEGHLWMASFGGWRIDRFNPGGAKVGEVRFPCANVTKLAFGGADLRTVYVTTARKGLSQEELAAQPLAGSLFSFQVETPGLAQYKLRIEE